MDKRKIVKIVAQKNGMSQKDVTMVFDEIFSTMLEGLKEEGHVGLSGFGSFNVKNVLFVIDMFFQPKKLFCTPKIKKLFLGWQNNLSLRQME